MSVKAKAKREQLIVEARHESMIVSSSAPSSFRDLSKSHQNPPACFKIFNPTIFYVQNMSIINLLVWNLLTLKKYYTSISHLLLQVNEDLTLSSIKQVVLSLHIFVLLASSGHNRCTSLVCSCYVAPRNSDSKDGESSRIGTSSNHRKQKLSENKYGLFHEFCSEESEVQVKSTSGIGRDNGRSNEPQIEPMPLKSNLKKASEALEFNQRLRMGSRKVNWPDDHGKDIAHVQEFEPSASEDGELESVRNSCVCVIQ